MPTQVGDRILRAPLACPAKHGAQERLHGHGAAGQENTALLWSIFCFVSASWRKLRKIQNFLEQLRMEIFCPYCEVLLNSKNVACGTGAGQWKRECCILNAVYVKSVHGQSHRLEVTVLSSTTLEDSTQKLTCAPPNSASCPLFVAQTQLPER